MAVVAESGHSSLMLSAFRMAPTAALPTAKPKNHIPVAQWPVWSTTEFERLQWSNIPSD
jgi:hypothetical protein